MVGSCHDRRALLRRAARIAALVGVTAFAGGCIGEGCSGKLAADNASQRLGVPLFKYKLPPGATLISRDVAAGNVVYGTKAGKHQCAIGARQVIATKLTKKQLEAHFSRVRIPRLLTRAYTRYGAVVRVQHAGKHKDGRPRYHVTVTDCCRNFGSFCADKK